jgi:hypothetical protein
MYDYGAALNGHGSAAVFSKSRSQESSSSTFPEQSASASRFLDHGTKARTTAAPIL